MLYITMLIISLLIGIVSGIIEGWGILDKIANAFVNTLFGFVAGIVLILVTMGVAHLIFEEEYVETTSKEVYSLQDNIGSEGQFFLGSGSVDSEMKYYFMTKENKGLNAKSVDAAKAYVKEDDNVKPKVQYYEQSFKNKFMQWLTPAFPDEEYVFHIPKDSIIQNYNIDLE